MNFIDSKDQSLAKVFLQEIEDAKRQVKNSITAQYFPNILKAPNELLSIEKNPSRFSNGFLTFCMFN